MTRLTRAIVLGVGIALASLQSLWADVQPHALFSDGSVLQQGIKVPVWGTAEDGEAITVELVEPGGDAGAAKVLQTKKCTAAAKKWRVDLDPIPAGGPYELKISGNNWSSCTMSLWARFGWPAASRTCNGRRPECRTR